MCSNVDKMGKCFLKDRVLESLSISKTFNLIVPFAYFSYKSIGFTVSIETVEKSVEMWIKDKIAQKLMRMGQEPLFLIDILVVVSFIRLTDIECT